MQDLYFFFEKSECKTRTPYKIGNSYLNHFAINEDAAFEIRSVNFLQQSSAQMAEVWNEQEYKKHEFERFRKQDYDAKIFSSCLQRKSDSQDKTEARNSYYLCWPLLLSVCQV